MAQYRHHLIILLHIAKFVRKELVCFWESAKEAYRTARSAFRREECMHTPRGSVESIVAEIEDLRSANIGM